MEISFIRDVRLTPLIKHTRVYQEILEEQTVYIIVRLVKKKFGRELSEEILAQIESLPLSKERKFE